jgi:hypothetical protein
LAAAANAHQNTDLILISASVEDRDLESAWFYMPRMLHERSEVLRESRDSNGQPTFSRVAASEVAERAGKDAATAGRGPRRRAA